MIVIALCGPANSGKTTVAKYLARAYGARVFAFAAPIKDILRRGFAMSEDQLYGSLKTTVDERYLQSPRDLMLKLGDGIRVALGADFFAKQTLSKLSGTGLVVIEDLRFLSEAEALDAWCETFGEEGYIWRLDTPWREITSDPTHQSESEWEIIVPDRTIASNKASLDDLYREVDHACIDFGIFPVLSSIEAP